ncbi:MAG: ABC transporter permease [Methanobacteriota archaeon]
MSISLPTYTRRETPLLGRSKRVGVIITTGLRRELRRPASIVVTGVGAALTTIFSVVLVFFAPLFLPGLALDLSFFYLPASNGAVLFFVTLIAAIVGSGLIADDLHSMALTLYLSRPITHADYVLAKAAILGPLIALVSVVPLVVTPIVAALLGVFPWDVALPAIGRSVLVGILFGAFYTAATLFLSSLTTRRAYAAAGVFAITFGLTFPAQILTAATGNPTFLYASAWENYLAVARALFGFVPPAPTIDWPPALAILLAATGLAALATYARMRTREVVAT